MSHRKRPLPPSQPVVAAPVQAPADQLRPPASTPGGPGSPGAGASAAESPAAAAPNLDALLAYVWKVHDYTNDLIRFADTKASMILALASGILGILFGAKIHYPFTKSWFTPPGPDWREIALGSGALMALGLLGASITIGVTTIVPRLNKTKTTSFTFWHGILQHGDPKAYATRLLPLTKEEMFQSLAEEVFVLASICQKKYQHVQWSIWLAALGAAMGCVVFLCSS